VALVTIGPCTQAGEVVSTEVVRRLHAEGATVVVCDKESEPGTSLVKELGERARFLTLDVTSWDDWTGVVSDVVGDLGGIDVLANCARTRDAHPADTVEVSVEEYVRVVAVNQMSVFLGMRAVLPAMIQSRRGAIVNLASIDGLRGVPGWAPYCAANHGVVGLTRSTALEVGQYGIRVNAVCASPSSAIAAELDSETYAGFRRQLPMGRLAEPHEVASVVAFLASDDSSCVTGTTLAADVGRMAGPAPAAVVQPR
jgi:3alpha(or 20beta)-hydroxysteroid dehydrogenase